MGDHPTPPSPSDQPPPVSVEVTIENPGIHSRRQSLWDQAYVRQFLERWSDRVWVYPTSYCQYATLPDKLYPQKHTSILSTMPNLPIKPPCTRTNSCPDLREARVHQVVVSGRDGKCGLPPRERNALPEELVHRIFGAWLRVKWHAGYRTFVFLDLFAGWGSLRDALHTFPSSDVARTLEADSGELRLRLLLARTQPAALVRYVGFDMLRRRRGHREPTVAEARVFHARGSKKRRVDVETETEHVGNYLSHEWSLSQMVADEVEEGPTAVLVHASPPCTTFSSQALAIHRPTAADASNSPLADEHDLLVQKLLSEIEAVTGMASRDAGLD